MTSVTFASEIVVFGPAAGCFKRATFASRRLNIRARSRYLRERKEDHAERSGCCRSTVPTLIPRICVPVFIPRRDETPQRNHPNERVTERPRPIPRLVYLPSARNERVTITQYKKSHICMYMYAYTERERSLVRGTLMSEEIAVYGVHYRLCVIGGEAER